MSHCAISPVPADEHVPHQQALLDGLGITARPDIAYERNGCRYTNTGDANAFARRASR